MIADLTAWQWAGAIAASALVGLSKAGFGGGAAVLAVPLMTAVLGPTGMLSVLLLVLITGDIFSLIHYPKDHDNRNLAMLIPGLLAGVGGGYLALNWFLSLPNSKLWMNRMVGGLCLAFVLLQLYRMGEGLRVGRRAAPYRPRYWHGIGVGTAAGFTSTLAHAGGPLITLFLLPQELGKRLFVGTTIIYFLVGNTVKLVPYYFQGLMTRPNLVLSLMLLPAVVAGTLAGVWLHKRFSDRAFMLIVYTLAFVFGLYFVIGWEPGGGGGKPAEEPAPPSATALFERGLQEYGAGDFEQAAADFRTAVGGLKAPRREDAAFNGALSLYRAGRYGEADAAFAAVGAAPESRLGLWAGYNRGNCAYRQGRFEPAVQWFGRTSEACRGAPGLDAGELLDRAEHNLALARVRLTAAQAGSPAGSPAAATGGAGASEAASESALMPAEPGVPERLGEPAAAGLEGDSTGVRGVTAVLAHAIARDSGPVLRAQAPPIRAAADW